MNVAMFMCITCVSRMRTVYGYPITTHLYAEGVYRASLGNASMIRYRMMPIFLCTQTISVGIKQPPLEYR